MKNYIRSYCFGDKFFHYHQLNEQSKQVFGKIILQDKDVLTNLKKINQYVDRLYFNDYQTTLRKSQKQRHQQLSKTLGWREQSSLNLPNIYELTQLVA